MLGCNWNLGFLKVFLCAVVFLYFFIVKFLCRCHGGKQFASAICTTSGIRARLGFNPLNTVKMLSTKYDVEKFCRKGKFSLWQKWMKDLLIQQGVHKAMLRKEKKPEKMKDEEWVDRKSVV